jgi:hypothetical protein
MVAKNWLVSLVLGMTLATIAATPIRFIASSDSTAAKRWPPSSLKPLNIKLPLHSRSTGRRVISYQGFGLVLLDQARHFFYALAKVRTGHKVQPLQLKGFVGGAVQKNKEVLIAKEFLHLRG